MTEQPDLADPGRLRSLTETGLQARPSPRFDAIASRLRERLGVPVALVSLVGADRQFFPGMVGLDEPWASRRQTPLSHSMCSLVVATEEPLIVTDARIDSRVRASLAVSELNVVAYAGFPLTDAAGRVLGSLCAIDTEPRAWTAAELAVHEDLAHVCSLALRLVVADLAAERERMRSDEAEDRLRAAYARSQTLLAASQALSHTSDLEEIRATVTSLVSGDLKPAYVGLTLVEPARRLHRIDDPLQPVGPEDGSAFSSLDADTPIALAARRGVAQVYPDKATLRAAFPVGAGHRYDELGLEALVAAPIPGNQDVIGALLFGWTQPHQIDLIEQAVVTTLAGYVGHALERTEFLRRRITVAHELQQAMLPDLPTVAGLELAARYLPAAVDDEVGGDWYDAVRLPVGDEQVLSVTIGDITGHDIRAAAQMSQVRNMARQAAWERPGQPPSHVVAALEDACAATGIGASGTLVHAQLVAGGGHGAWSVRWTVAGHPPPLVHHADGQVTVLDGTDVMFGFPHLRVAPRADRSAVLNPGDTVLLYTDGLIERRDLSIDDGIDNLVRTIAAIGPGENLPTMVDSVITQLTDDTANEDDVALLAIRVARG